jgi:hypothetical protein
MLKELKEVEVVVGMEEMVEKVIGYIKEGNKVAVVVLQSLVPVEVEINLLEMAEKVIEERRVAEINAWHKVELKKLLEEKKRRLSNVTPVVEVKVVEKKEEKVVQLVKKPVVDIEKAKREIRDALLCDGIDEKEKRARIFAEGQRIKKERAATVTSEVVVNKNGIKQLN